MVVSKFRKLRKPEVSSQSKSFWITCFNLWLLLLLHPWWSEQACLSHHLLLNCVNCIPVNPYYPQTFTWYLSAYFSISLTEISVFFQSLLFYVFNIPDLLVYTYEALSHSYWYFVHFIDFSVYCSPIYIIPYFTFQLISFPFSRPIWWIVLFIHIITFSAPVNLSDRAMVLVDLFGEIKLSF